MGSKNTEAIPGLSGEVVQRIWYKGWCGVGTKGGVEGDVWNGVRGGVGVGVRGVPYECVCSLPEAGPPQSQVRWYRVPL